jgi:nicotinate-nucleotide--dimethylbenzimidazole phosphoribosyltransferase
MTASGAFHEVATSMSPLDEGAMDAARVRQSQLTKPPGALGELEHLGVCLAGITGRCPPAVPERPVVVVFAADHGVVSSGVTPWPQEVTAQMVANIAEGGAAINAVARQVGAEVRVVDVGVATALNGLPGVEHRKIRLGTDDLALSPAMSERDLGAALDVGADVARGLVADGHDLLLTGDMGIGNTTASAAVISALLGRDAAAVTGRGTGIDDSMLAHKREVVDRAVARLGGRTDATSVLIEVGGLEIAALAGFIIGGTARSVPVVIDGVIALAALLAADALVPGTAVRCIAGHRSTEPGAAVVLEHLALTPLLDLGMRLGEGTGACLSVPIVQAAARILGEMATFEDAAVSQRPD